MIGRAPSAGTHPAVTILRGSLTAERPTPCCAGGSGVAAGEFDPFDSAVVADPAAHYRRLHASGAVHRCSPRKLWILTAHADVRRAARDHEALSSANGVSELPARLPMMLTADRPHHAELRRLVAPHFAAAPVARRRRLIESFTDTAIDRMLERPGSDAVAELAGPLPVLVIAEVLGVPPADLASFRRWSDAIVEGFQPRGSLAAIPRSARVAIAILRLHAYVRRHLMQLRAEPGDDVISALDSGHEGSELAEHELFWFVLMLLVAGNETTTNLLGSLLVAFAGDPAAYTRLREDRALIEPAVEEGLRWGSPVQGLFRTALRDYPLAGGTIPAGSRILLSYGAANRDPRRYQDPDRFDVDRGPTDHLAFGAGIHFCLGAHLARLEARAVLSRFAERVAQIELAGPVVWTRNPMLRGPSHLPIRLAAS